METWLVLDAHGYAINRVLWDGVSDWQPPAGCTLIPDDGRPLVDVPNE